MANLKNWFLYYVRKKKKNTIRLVSEDGKYFVLESGSSYFILER